MSLPFLDGATGDPIRLQRKIGPQAVSEVPADEAALKDFRSYGGPIIFTPNEVEPQVIAGFGQPQSSLPGKTVIEDITMAMGDVDPNNIGVLNMLANLFTQYGHVPQTGYEEWIFSLTQPTVASKFMTLREDNDVMPRFRIVDLKAGGLALTAGVNENLALEFSCVAGGYDFHGIPTQSVGTASDLPSMNKTWNGNWALDAVDQDIYILVNSITGDDINLSCKIGSLAAYSYAFDAVLGTQIRLFDETGARIGVLAEQIRAYWPSGATLVTSDEFIVPKRISSVWAQALDARRSIPAINTIFIIDGIETRTEGGWNVTYEKNIEARPDVAGKQGQTARVLGDLRVTIEPTRDLVDLTLQNALMNASTVSMIIDAQTDVAIGATTRPFRFLQVYPECRVFGSTFGVTPGGEDIEETITIVPFEPETPFVYESYPAFTAHANIVVENEIVDL